MISRGFFIGAIVDEFSTIAEKIAMRNRLGYTDLSVHAEEYFRNVLNRVYGWNLESLNKTRANEPGLDLGDTTARVGVQVTSDASSAKVKATLAAVTDEQRTAYSTILVLIVGKKQTSYTIAGEAADRLAFTDANIWDVTHVARDALALDLERLNDLHSYVDREATRLRMELEVPDAEGNYATTNFDQWEPIAEAKVGDGDRFVAYIVETYNDGLEDKVKEKIKTAIQLLAAELRGLPRITREFLVMLIERRETRSGKRRPHASVPRALLEKIERVYLGSYLKGELTLLEDASLVTVEPEDPFEYGPAEIYIWLSKNEDLQTGLVDFVDRRGLALRDVVGKADFSAF